MIDCRKEHLAARCRERGYTLEEVRACIVNENGDMVTVDENHPSYPKESKTKLKSFSATTTTPLTVGGAGTELKKLLQKIGIKATPTCSCNARAKTMDSNGIEWCEQNIDTIVGWLREEANKRGLLFIDAAGRMLVKRAIKNAKRNSL